MRRRRLPPDTRPDWRDPSMPVWVDGTDKWTGKPMWNDGYPHAWRLCPPEVAQFVSRKQMEIGVTIQPPWTRDPTYNLRQPGRSRLPSARYRPRRSIPPSGSQ